MRVFVAVDIPKETGKEIKKIQDKLTEFKGKKTELENLHLTLKFLGNIDEEKIELVKEKLRSIKAKKFESIIDEIGFFDNRKSSKYGRQLVVWLHMSNCDELQKEIDEKLSGLFEKERRFMSHLTIARVKKIEDGKRFVKGLKNVKFEKMKFTIKEFKLKKSTLAKKGPVYGDLEVYRLVW